MAKIRKRFDTLSGILILVIFCLTLLFILIRHHLLRMPCFIYEVTGLQCPGCGGTRAINSLTNGQILPAFQYNVVITSIALILPLILLYNLASQFIFKKKSGLDLKKVLTLRLALILLSIIIIFTVLRNIMT